MEESASVVVQFSPQMKAELKQAGQAIKNCVAEENVDRNALNILYKAFKIAAGQCESKSADGGPVLDLEHFSLIVKSVRDTLHTVYFHHFAECALPVSGGGDRRAPCCRQTVQAG